MEIYKNIKKYQVEFRISKTKLDRCMGYTDQSMCDRIEAGKVDFPFSEIVKTAEVLHLSVAELLGALTLHEKQLLYDYRQCDKRGKFTILQAARDQEYITEMIKDSARSR